GGGLAAAERAPNRRGSRPRRHRLLRRRLPEGRDNVRRRHQDLGPPGRDRAAGAIRARARVSGRLMAHIALAVADQERSRHFYEAYFEFDPASARVADDGVLLVEGPG